MAMSQGTRNFPKHEIECKCGCGGTPDVEFMYWLQQLRDTVGFALPVNSGYRCPDHNARVSGTGRTGPHTTGFAVDISVFGDRAYLVLSAAIKLGFTGIGVSQKGAPGQRFLHLDRIPNSPNIPRPYVWSY